MFSKDSARQADACRFCWMCRHICPVAGSTGNEAWTPRARGLMISMIERGTEFDKDIASTMFHCTLCDACANDCVTGYKPSEFTREARMHAVVEDLAPTAVMKSIETITECGNIFGLSAMGKALGDLPEKADVLLFLGQTAEAMRTETGVHAVSILKKAGVDFTVLADEPASGAYLGELMGFTGDVQAVAAHTAKMIADTGAKTLVVLNPADAAMFKEQYGALGLLSGIEIVTMTAFVASLISDGKLKVNKGSIAGSLQEPVKLTRALDETAPFKAIANACGVELNELFLNGKMSRCIGTVPFDMYAPEVVSQMVRVRCEDAVRLGSGLIITASPDDFYLMNKYAADGVKIADIYDILDGLC